MKKNLLNIHNYLPLQDVKKADNNNSSDLRATILNNIGDFK